MKKISLILLIPFISYKGCAQSASQNNQNTQRVGGSCEGCEAIYETPVPFKKLSHVVTLPYYNVKGPRLHISGVVYQRDVKTPAKDVVLYIYHTDQTGQYPTKGNETGWGKRHGYLRGWIKTNEKGEYQFHTLKPAGYPGRRDPAHIHVTVKEPGKNEYYIDDILFDDDSRLTYDYRSRLRNIGSNGIVQLKNVDGIWKAKRDIVLGLNVQDYSK